MYLAGTIMMSIALTAGLLSVFSTLPGRQKGQPMSENQILGIRALEIGVPLAALSFSS
ncbi:hypothetical protein [Halobacillus sp. B29]|uniref:hypothetical protein n=1 Tax=Halobacillus sp. B29 TaxID=3457432 RepID=UPI003FCCCA88